MGIAVLICMRAASLVLPRWPSPRPLPAYRERGRIAARPESRPPGVWLSGGADSRGCILFVWYDARRTEDRRVGSHGGGPPVIKGRENAPRDQWRHRMVVAMRDSLDDRE